MPTPMSVEDLASAMTNAKELETFEFRSQNDDDDFIMATLYRDRLGHFRVITSSGMNSAFAGAADVAERLTATEVSSWKEFQ